MEIRIQTLRYETRNLWICCTPIFLEHFQKKVRRKTEGDEEEGQGEESYQSRHRSELVDS